MKIEKTIVLIFTLTIGALALMGFNSKSHADTNVNAIISASDGNYYPRYNRGHRHHHKPRRHYKQGKYKLVESKLSTYTGSKIIQIDNVEGTYPIDVRMVIRGQQALPAKVQAGKRQDFYIPRERFLGKIGDEIKISSNHWLEGETIGFKFDGKEGEKASKIINLKASNNAFYGKSVLVKLIATWFNSSWNISVIYIPSDSDNNPQFYDQNSGFYNNDNNENH